MVKMNQGEVSTVKMGAMERELTYFDRMEQNDKNVRTEREVRTHTREIRKNKGEVQTNTRRSKMKWGGGLSLNLEFPSSRMFETQTRAWYTSGWS